MSPQEPINPGQPSAKRRRLWPWILVLLAAVTIAWFAFRVRSKLGNQLTQEKLEAARELWRAHQPPSYEVHYVTTMSPGAISNNFQVRVENKKVIAAEVNDQVEPANRLHHYGMERLFDYVERFLGMDDLKEKKEGQRTYARADFDPNDGRLLYYERRVLGMEQSVTIAVTKFLPRK